MNICSKCMSIVPIDETQNTNRKRIPCLKCRRAYQKEWYARNRDKRKNQLNGYDRKRVENNRKYIISYLKDHPCVDCGESDIIVLEFDHDEPLSKEMDISVATNTWGIERLKAEIEKCSIRCANCHRRRTTGQLGYYRGQES